MSRLTVNLEIDVWLHKLGPSMTPCNFELGPICSGLRVMIFHKVSPRTHHNHL